MMRIAVNARLLLPGKLEGIGWFARETLSRITRSNPFCEFLFFFDRPWDPEFIFSGNITPVVLPPRARHPVLWQLWFEYSVKYALNKYKADLFLSPDGFIPLSSSAPSLAVIHDINFIHRPDFHPLMTRMYYCHYFPKFAGRAQRIATVSDYSRKDIAGSLSVDPGKIDVVYNGASSEYEPLAESEKDPVKEKVAGGTDYFLYAGSFHERKNICGLLEAYDLFRRESGKEIKLVLAGERMYKYPRMDKTLNEMKYREGVIFAGRKEPPELRLLYGASLALVYVPFFEGFGLPVLEAMQCETPVITSNCTSLPEVAGNAALLADPGDIRSMTDCMHRVCSEKGLREKLIEKGRARKTSFSWEQTASLLWSSILKTIDMQE